MRKSWFDEAWNDYIYWQGEDKKTIKRINELIKDIERNGLLVGIGKPEQLKGNLTGFCSRQISKFDRLVYRSLEDDVIEILSCRGHYNDIKF
jgi:toxin YoeB